MTKLPTGFLGEEEGREVESKFSESVFEKVAAVLYTTSIWMVESLKGLTIP